MPDRHLRRPKATIKRGKPFLIFFLVLLVKQTAVVLMQMAPSHIRAVDLLEELSEVIIILHIVCQVHQHAMTEH